MIGQYVGKWLARRVLRPGIARALAWVPTPPRVLRRRYASPHTGPWPALPPVPTPLRTLPGIRRDRAAEAAAFVREPLHDFHRVHHEAIAWATEREWASFLPVAPRLARAARAVERSTRAVERSTRARSRRPRASDRREELTPALRAEATRLGFGAIGVARYDPAYTFVEADGPVGGDRVVVCLLEQHYEATQATPSVRTNKAAYDGEAEAILLAARLASFLRRRGHRARAHGNHDAVVIPYAVEAGLGQLGLNGQLLTPAAGSRCRLSILTTDAPLVYDRPVDYGIPAVCDACEACVRRCPAGAIPLRRQTHRGVEKAKINQARCFPVVAQAAGCGVCMKVCPVQRYGLAPVLEELHLRGRILGRGSDELEGYYWAPEGRRIGPDERPKLGRSFFHPAGFLFDVARKTPTADARQFASPPRPADAPADPRTGR